MVEKTSVEIPQKSEGQKSDVTLKTSQSSGNVIANKALLLFNINLFSRIYNCHSKPTTIASSSGMSFTHHLISFQRELKIDLFWIRTRKGNCWIPPAGNWVIDREYTSCKQFQLPKVLHNAEHYRTLQCTEVIWSRKQSLLVPLQHNSISPVTPQLNWPQSFKMNCASWSACLFGAEA